MVKREPSSHPNLSKLSKTIYTVSPELQSLILNFGGKMGEIVNGRFSNDDEVPFPETVDIELTAICNLRCKMCWWWGEEGIAKKMVNDKNSLIYNQLKTEQVIGLIDEVAEHKSSMYFSGAEVFTRPDIMEILLYAEKKKISTALTTNGTLIKDVQVEKLSHMKNLRINFSIDGPREIHDGIRGSGNFDRTTLVIRKLLKQRGSSKFPIVNTNTTFSPEIIGNIEELINYLVDLKVDNISFQHLWFTTQDRAEQHKERLRNEFRIEDDGPYSHIIDTISMDYLKNLSIEVEKIQRNRFPVPVRVNPRLSKENVIRYYTDLDFSKRKKCPIPWSKVLIKANGDVMFCPDEWVTKYVLGNVRDSTISALWNNDLAIKFRNSLRERGLFPVCGRCCSINMN